MRGTLVHAVLERLYDLPAAERTVEGALELLEPAWVELREEPGVAELFAAAQGEGAETDVNAPESLEAWLASAGKLVERYFTLEDPPRIEPEGREELVEVTLPDGLLLRGYVDRLDVARNGALRVVDYKTGSMPREAFEGKALFQMKFYALVLWRTRGVVAAQLKLIYLGDGDALTYAPDEEELLRFERTLLAIWSAIERAVSHRRLPAEPDPAVRLVRPPGRLPGVRRHSPAVPGRGRRSGRLADPAHRRARLRQGRRGLSSARPPRGRGRRARWRARGRDRARSSARRRRPCACPAVSCGPGPATPPPAARTSSRSRGSRTPAP